MTLRHRLLLVYLLVVLLSMGTLGVAIYELNRTQSIHAPFLTWNDVVSDVQRLRAEFEAMPAPETGPSAFEAILTGIQQKVGATSEFLDVDYVRDIHIIRLRRAYQRWLDAPPDGREEAAQGVKGSIAILEDVVGDVLRRLVDAAQQQRTSKWVLTGGVLGFAVLNVLVVGWLLRRWLLWPMERLNRQVEALGKDQPPPEPLLTSPLELARLAGALDRARVSLQVYRQQLIDNERLTTIGQFAAQLAHNLRNPLASIRAAAQVTARHERANEYVHERMDEVVASVDRLNRWIGGLMEIARREPTPTRSADVVPLLRQLGETLQPELAAKEIAFKVEAPLDGLECAHDPATLEQALVAMVVNAIEASPLGGSIVLRAERMEGSAEERGTRDDGRGQRAAGFSPRGAGALKNAAPSAAGPGDQATKGQGDNGTRGQGENGLEEDRAGDPRCKIQNPKSDGFCRISIHDRGPGLPVEHPERIFEFSYSTKQRGMGLGLALARLTLQRQGGDAHACNHPDGGAMVYVDLPINEVLSAES